MTTRHRASRPSVFASGMILASYLLSSTSCLAFNPNADTDAPTVSAAPALPSNSAIYNAALKNGYIPPVQTLEMPKPLYPDRINSAPAPVAEAALPPVSPSVEAEAQKRIAIEQATSAPAPYPVATPSVSITPSPIASAPVAPVPVASGGFIAPAPVIASSPLAAPAQVVTAPAPTVVTAPTKVVVATPAVSPIPLISKAPPEAVAIASREAITAPVAHNGELSDQTRSILSHVPGNLDKARPSKAGSVAISRVSPEVKDLLGNKAKEDSYETVGLSIKVRRPGLDTNFELNRAYTALMGGDTDAAIDTYKNILSTDATNQDALFGLAATYHRLGNLDKARPLYGALLKINPQHREGLNNFLVLVSDESPQDALPELERLEARNPDFSPIPAQTAIVLDKLGFKDEARAKMLRAIELAPDNMTYKYNLAIMLDHQGRVADATALYRMLIESSLRGEKVPASTDAMQRRLNYLSAAPDNAATHSVAMVAPSVVN